MLESDIYPDLDAFTKSIRALDDATLIQLRRSHGIELCRMEATKDSELPLLQMEVSELDDEISRRLSLSERK